MIKKVLTIAILSVLAITTFGFINNESKLLDNSQITAKLISLGLIDSEDVDDQPLNVIADIKDEETQIVIYFVEIPEWSSTGGAKGFVIASTGDDIKLLTEFFGSKKILTESLKIVDSVVVYEQLYKNGGCCYFSTEIHLNLIDPSKNIIPNVPDTLETYLARHNLIADASSLSESVGNYSWIDNQTVTLERTVADTKGTNYLAETWQYNIQTKEYKLIK